MDLKPRSVNVECVYLEVKSKELLLLGLWFANLKFFYSMKPPVLWMLKVNIKYSKLSNMKDHIRTHLAVKMFKCSICNKGFVWQGNRDRHERKKVCLPKSAKQGALSKETSRKSIKMA